MNSLDAAVIRQSLSELVSSRLAGFEAFPEIDSTNSYLMQLSAPSPGQLHVAVTDNQTQGRGRHGRTWQSPRGSGLCLSLAYTFQQLPANLPALTLALGLGAIDALESLGVKGVQLKWPNDLVAADGKLGGILTETHARHSDEISVVSGVGLNVDLGADLALATETGWAGFVSDLAGFAGEIPCRDELAARLINSMGRTFLEYEDGGFAGFVSNWRERDWLLGRELTIDTPQRQVQGIGAGVAEDGALLVDTGVGACSRITSGSVLLAGGRGAAE